MRDIIRHDAPHRPFVYELHAGAMAKHPIASLTLPEAVQGSLFLGGPTSLTLLRSLEALAEYQERVTPWVTTYIGGEPVVRAAPYTDVFPAQAYCRYTIDGTDYVPVGGVAYAADPAMDSVTLLAASGGPTTARLLAHETFHHVWRYLLQSARGLLMQDLRTAIVWDSSYFDSDEEVACRAFEAWTAAQHHGLPPVLDPTGDAEILFRAVASGDFATGLMKRRHIVVSPAVLKRRSMLLRAAVAGFENRVGEMTLG